VTAPQGIWGAVLLPIDMKGAIDWAALADELDILCASGLDGLYTNGTAGEFHTQTEAEFDRLTDLVAARAGAAGVPFQIGVCQSNPRVARDRLTRCRTIGAAGAQIILPDWWPPSPPEIERFIDGMQEAAGDLPLILYNVPGRTVADLSNDTALRLAQVPGIVGIKDATGSMERAADLLRRAPADFALYSGDDGSAMPFMLLGGSNCASCGSSS
jgi:dihydrodipicolinate synthase/N-acetylneuraminate lyase